MQKKYIAPQVEVTPIGSQTIICTSVPSGALPVYTGGYITTDDQW